MAAELLGLARVPQPAPSAAPRTALADGLAETAHKPQAERPNEPGAPPQDAQAVPVSADYRPPALSRSRRSPAGNLADLLPEGAPPKRHPGLLPPGHARALLTHLGGRLRPDGDFDAVRAVQLLAHGEPLFSLPRLWVETTRGGTELALDIGPGMQPFRSDLDHLPAQLSQVVGQQNLETRWFEDCPAGGNGVYVTGKLEPVRYQLPPAGTLIVVVTTFGVRGGGPAMPSVMQRWQRFVAAASRARTPLIALTPLREERRRTRAATPARRGHLGPERERAGRERCRPVRTARRPDRAQGAR